MIDIVGEWAIGRFHSNGVVTNWDNIPLGVWTLDGSHFLITLNERGGNVVYEGTYNEATGVLSGTYKNYKYAWIAKVDDPAATFVEGIYLDEKQK